MAVPSLRSGDTPGGCGYGREVPSRRGSVEQPFRPGSLLMPFYPAVLPDVTLAGGADAVFELPGGAGMVAVRVQDLISPAGQGLGKDGRPALVAAGAGRICSGDLVVFLQAGRAPSARWRSSPVRKSSPASCAAAIPVSSCPAPNPRSRCFTGPTAASSAPITPRRSHSPVTATIPAFGVSARSAAPRAPAHASASRRVSSSPDGCLSTRDDIDFSNQHHPSSQGNPSLFPRPCHRPNRGFGSEA